MQEARAYPNGVVATPHYLAIGRRPRDAGRRRERDRRRVRREFVLGRRDAVHVRLRRRPPRDGVGRRAARVPSASVARRGATVAGVRARDDERLSPRATCRSFGPHPVTVPGAVDGWFTLLEGAGPGRSASSRGRALHYAEEGFPLTRRGASFFTRPRQLYDHFDLRDFARAYYGDVDAGDWVRQPELARTIRTLADDGPDAYYRGPIGAAIAARCSARAVHDRRRRRRAHGRVGRAAARAVRATSRSSRCRRRPRASPRSKRCASSTGSTSAPTAPTASTADRGGEARARRPATAISAIPTR